MTHATRLALAWAIASSCSACSRESSRSAAAPPAVAPAAPRTPVDAAPPPAVAPAAIRTPGDTAAPPAHPSLCEVEISGHVRLPKRAKNAPPPLTFVALGDCLAPSPRILGFGGSTFGRFFVEVMAPWGSDITICAASEPAPEQPSRLYGKAPIVMHAEKSGEVEFKDLLIDLAPGPPKRFPHTPGGTWTTP